jgi:hypothetical protein
MGGGSGSVSQWPDKTINHEGHNVPQRLGLRSFPWCNFVFFVVEACQLSHYLAW